MLLHRKSVELLAPAGTWDAMTAGIAAGADAAGADAVGAAWGRIFCFTRGAAAEGSASAPTRAASSRTFRVRGMPNTGWGLRMLSFLIMASETV